MEIQMERVEVHELLAGVLETLRPLAREHGSELSLAEEGCAREIMTDPERVRQVLVQLLSYAVESGESEPVRVHCSGEPDGGVAVEVVSRSRDAVASLPRVLGEFIRLDEATECDSELQLCLRLADLLHGTLEVGARTEEGEEGTVFRLTLPKAPHGA